MPSSQGKKQEGTALKNVARSNIRGHKHWELRVFTLQMAQLSLEETMSLKNDIFCLHCGELSRTDICDD